LIGLTRSQRAGIDDDLDPKNLEREYKGSIIEHSMRVKKIYLLIMWSGGVFNDIKAIPNEIM
jgi:hypothetical protein